MTLVGTSKTVGSAVPLLLLAVFSVFWGASLFLYRIPPNGLVSSYYDNEKAEGYPAFMLKTPHADLNEVLGSTQFTSGQPPEHISIVWTGWLRVKDAKTYLFSTFADDSAGILIDGRVVVENDGSTPPKVQSGEVFLSQGMHRIKVTYVNRTDEGFLKIRWGDPGGAPVPIRTEFLYPARYSPLLSAIPRDPRIIFWVYPLVWCLLFVGIQQRERRATVAKRVAAVIGLCVVALVLMQLRYVCLPPEKGQTLLIYSFCFLLSLPCVHILCKLLFPDVIRVFLVTFYALLALFPYKVFFPGGTDLCKIFSDPAVPTRFGFERHWVLILYVLLSLLVAAAWQWSRTRKFAGTVRGTDLAVYALCLAAVTMQIAPRLDTNSPRMVVNGVHDGKKACGYESSTTYFFGHCVMCDAPQHTVTNGILKGVRSDEYRWLVINRRLFNGYLYSLVEPFVHPYYAAILVNGLFLYLLAVAGYALARHLALPRTVTVVFPLLLTGNSFFLWETVDSSFYIQRSAFAMFVLAAACILDVYGRQVSLLDRALFCSILACSSLVYDPFLLVGFILLWGLYLALKKAAVDRKGAFGTLLRAAGYAAVPILSQTGLEYLLQHFRLAGNQDNTFARDIVFSKLTSLPGYVIHHFDEFTARCNEEFIRMFLVNPVSVEFFAIVGIFGLFCFATLLPKYVGRDHLVPLYAIYASCMIIPIAAAIAAHLPPASRYASIYTDFHRSTVYYPVIVLSQGIGIHHFAEHVGSRFSPAINGERLSYVIAGSIWLASFYQIVF